MRLLDIAVNNVVMPAENKHEAYRSKSALWVVTVHSGWILRPYLARIVCRGV